jgi:anti-anti-sigma regulatory factor
MRAILRSIDDTLVVRLEGEADSLVSPLDEGTGVMGTIDEQLERTGAFRLVVDFRDLSYIDGTSLRDLTEFLCGLARSKLVRFVGPGPALSRLDAALVRPLPSVYSQTVKAACSSQTPSFDPKTRVWRQFAEQFEPGFIPPEPQDEPPAGDPGQSEATEEFSPDETVIDLEQEAVYLKAQPTAAVNPMMRPLEFRRGEDGHKTRSTKAE